jgi:hypothetical protein
MRQRSPTSGNYKNFNPMKKKTSTTSGFIDQGITAKEFDFDNVSFS